MKINLAYLYPNELNLYGDNGNVEILEYRAKARNIVLGITKIGIGDPFVQSEFNLVFMGGGPDSAQKNMYEDLIKYKKPELGAYISAGKAGLFICGSYQLLGHYYQAADGSKLEGLSLLDLYTRHFGLHKPRCIGNVVCTLNPKLRHETQFNTNNRLGDTLVGFENHGGRTYLGSALESLATVDMGHGNNSEDHTEGVLYKGVIGTYLHGPILSKNPHLADYLISKASGINTLSPLQDNLIVTAHNTAKLLKQ